MQKCKRRRCKRVIHSITDVKQDLSKCSESCRAKRSQLSHAHARTHTQTHTLIHKTALYRDVLKHMLPSSRHTKEKQNKHKTKLKYMYINFVTFHRWTQHLVSVFSAVPIRTAQITFVLHTDCSIRLAFLYCHHYLYISLSLYFRPDVIVMVGWALNINYLSIYLSLLL